MTDDLWNAAADFPDELPDLGPDRRPVAKVQAAGTAGALAVLGVFIAGTLGLEVPAEVGAALATLAAFVGGYFRRS